MSDPWCFVPGTGVHVPPKEASVCDERYDFIERIQMF